MANAAEGKANKKGSCKAGKRGGSSKSGGGSLVEPPHCGQVFECVKCEAMAALANLEENALPLSDQGTGAATNPKANAASAAADSLCGLLLALGSLGPWLAASGRTKELASLTRSLVLPATSPDGFNPSLARQGQAPSSSSGLSLGSNIKGAVNTTAAAAAAAVGGAMYRNKYLNAHALWCLYKCGDALPETLNAAVLDASLQCMAKLDEEEDEDEEGFEDAHAETSLNESSIGDSLNGSIMNGVNDESCTSNTSGDDDNDDVGSNDACGCMKPVRVAAAHVLYQLLQSRYPQAQLRLVLGRVVKSMIAAAKAEQDSEDGDEAKGACNGLPMRVCHLVAEVAEGDLLPHMGPLSKVLANQCLVQLSDGADMAESVALEALGMLASTLQHLWDNEEGDKDDDENDEGAAAEEAEDEAKGKTKKRGNTKSSPESSPAFSFGPDMRAVMSTVTNQLVLTLLPVLTHLWPDASNSTEGVGASTNTTSGGPYLEDAVVLLKLVLFHGGAHSSCESASTTSQPESEEVAAQGSWSEEHSQVLKSCALSFLRTLSGWVGTCEVDFATTAWGVAAHLAARQDVLPTAAVSVGSGESAADGDSAAAQYKAAAQEGREALLGLAARSFSEGDLAAVRASSLAIRRAMAPTTPSSSTSADQREPPVSAWPAPAVGKACEISCRALLDLRATSDECADAKAVAIWALVAACLSASGQGQSAAAMAALRAATPTPLSPVSGVSGGAASTTLAANAPAKKGSDKSDPLSALTQSFTEALKATASLREGGSYGGSGGGGSAGNKAGNNNDNDDDDDDSNESAVEVGFALAPATRKSLVLAAGRVAAALGNAVDCTAGLRRQVSALLDASFPHLVLLAEEAAEKQEGDGGDEEGGEEEEDAEGDANSEEEDEEVRILFIIS